MEDANQALEERALRDCGLLGRGREMGNALYAIEYAHLPSEAIRTIQLIAQAGPFPYPGLDGQPFGDRFGDLPSSGEYLEFTVPTPGISNRGKRRIVARKNGMLFFTACHYERIQGSMSPDQRRAATAAVDEQWRNGFYIITGMGPEMRQHVAEGIRRIRGGVATR